jgi:GAF domain-containing protein
VTAGDADASLAAALEALRATAVRAEIGRRIEGGAEGALLRSIVDATVRLFEAEAASIALYDPRTDRLVFEVAAGEQGQGVVGIAIPPGQGIAGYVFSTGQGLALSDVARDPRFGRAVAEQTGYLPRSIVAVPLVDGERTIGVLEVLDKRGSAAFSIRDVELAGVFASQAAVAIAATRVERDTRSLLAILLASLGGDALDEAGAERLASAATAELDGQDETRLWALVDRVARLRRADPGQVDLLLELLDVLVRRAELDAARPRRERGRRRRDA